MPWLLTKQMRMKTRMWTTTQDVDLDAEDEDDEEEEEEYSPDQEPSPDVDSRDEMTPSRSSTHPEDAEMYAEPANAVDTYDPPDQLSELPTPDEATHSVGASLKSSRRAARNQVPDKKLPCVPRQRLRRRSP